ncbi:autotransporter outer membrane beta-barrel domain-containing protein [Pseudomonas sp. H9]|uniref:autotransporter outer membrane beta-barrel domain-containing protein n=1 Tax=Pseudomonas sp. H9 TaxID=483968 RepID=UPI001057C36D|nr:autotransporter outer membrane beta-barrel domain-containing protein [Pseudomonas sp. H9]TDF84349.1 autotransporter outer membrane beta-barrel domain-containing protein [Pseudomonas sp. H9]
MTLNRFHSKTFRHFWLLCLPLATGSAIADQVLDNEKRTLPAGTVADSYRLVNGSVLNSDGSDLLNVVITDSTLNLSNASADKVVGANSHVSLDNARLTGDGLFEHALALTASTARINGSTLVNIGTQGAALAVHSSFDHKISQMQVTDSTLQGADLGVTVTDQSIIELRNTTVDTTQDSGIGVKLSAASASVIGGKLEGGLHGVAFYRGIHDPDRRDSTLRLEGTEVIGRNGSALHITEGSEATIDLLNGTTLSGKDGLILDVEQASKATVNVANSALTGNLKVSGNSTAVFTFDRANLDGNIDNEAGSTTDVRLQNASTLTGTLNNVSSLSVSASHWQMTGDSSVGALTLTDGTVSLGEQGEFYRLSMNSLAGAGTFVMSADFSQQQSSFIDISGSATGNHTLVVRSSGVDPIVDTRLHVIHAESGDARFALGGGTADLGAWSYKLVQDGNGKDWYLDGSTRTVSPGTRTAMALFNTAPTVWYGELASLRSRMGELRYNDGRSAGAWMRTYGNKYNVADASGVGYSQNQRGISFGADAPLPVGDGQWLVGLLAGHSRSDLDLTRGSTGSIDSYYAGAYTTWLDAHSGYYFDAVVKFNRYQNNAKVMFSDGARAKGDYDNHGLGTSLEVGRHIKLDQGYFLEPYAQLSAVFIQDKDYALSNGLEAEGDQTRSYLGKLGVTSGRRFELDGGRSVQPYVKAAYAHEFANNNKARVNDNVFNNDLSGSRGELGVGVSASLSRSFQVHGEFDYSNGKHIEQPYGVNLGLRYFW